MIDEWLNEIKKTNNPESLGMVLVHNGIVRGTAKNGKSVKAMQLSYNQEALEKCVKSLEKREGITAIRAWINNGLLNIGDDIMYVLVAGRFRTDVLPVFQELLSTIKNEIVHEKEIGC
ncbi:MAG: molybdenum cofactor biosynthesis protein MoaE [Smithella sp.]